MRTREARLPSFPHGHILGKYPRLRPLIMTRAVTTTILQAYPYGVAQGKILGLDGNRYAQ